MEEIKKIDLPDKYFNTGLKRSIMNIVTTNGAGLIIFFSILFIIFFSFYSNFEKEYKLKVASNFSREIKMINNSSTNRATNKLKINTLIKNYLKDKYINFIWISDRHGLLILHSSEKMKEESPDLKSYKEYKFIFQHNWTFNPDGTVIPIIKSKVYYNDTKIFFPVYNLGKKIDFIVEMNFKKYLTRIVYIPVLKIYTNIFYIVLFGLSLVITAFVVLLIAILSNKNHEEQIIRNTELTAKLRESGIENLPFQFTYNEKKIKNNYFAGLISYINNLLTEFHNKLRSRVGKQDQFKKIIPPAIFDSNVKQKKLKVLVKPDDIDLQQFLWGFYFKNKDIKSVPGYSTGIYHYHKEKDSDVIFNYYNISSSSKGFFAGKITDTDVNNKILHLSLLNYMFHYSEKSISNAKAYLANLNASLYDIGHTELGLDAGYITLNTDTNYIEIASTSFSPLIYYQAKTEETTYYKFNSVPLGAKPNDKFLGQLNKESFQLFPGDIILLPDPMIEKLSDSSKQKFEIHEIAKIINQYKSTSADIIAEKLKDAFNQFAIDFSKINDLFILVIKRNNKNE